jgi:hypothetical protein
MIGSTKMFETKDDSRAINELIQNILSYNHKDDEKTVVDIIYDLESEGSGLVQQSILSLPDKTEAKHEKEVH